MGWIGCLLALALTDPQFEPSRVARAAEVPRVGSSDGATGANDVCKHRLFLALGATTDGFCLRVCLSEIDATVGKGEERMTSLLDLQYYFMPLRVGELGGKWTIEQPFRIWLPRGGGGQVLQVGYTSRFWRML